MSLFFLVLYLSQSIISNYTANIIEAYIMFFYMLFFSLKKWPTVRVALNNMIFYTQLIISCHVPDEM